MILAGVPGGLVAVVAAACLWRVSIRHEPSVRNAYRWLAVVALLWGTGFVAEEGMAASGTGTSLTYADLLTLLALPTLGAGLAGLARATGKAERDDRRAARAQARSASPRPSGDDPPSKTAWGASSASSGSPRGGDPPSTPPPRASSAAR